MRNDTQVLAAAVASITVYVVDVIPYRTGSLPAPLRGERGRSHSTEHNKPMQIPRTLTIGIPVGTLIPEIMIATFEVLYVDEKLLAARSRQNSEPVFDIVPPLQFFLS